METKLFHKDVYIPEECSLTIKQMQEQFFGYKLSKHLQDHIKDNETTFDRKHNYTKEEVLSKLDTIKGNPREVFEVEMSRDKKAFRTKDWVLTKFCIRIPFNDNDDMCVAIRPDYSGSDAFYRWGFLIVTIWINSNSDSHTTLDVTKYCSEEDWEKANGEQK